MARENQLGALWIPASQNPKAPFANGNITVNGIKINIVVWKNGFKKPEEKTPDYFIEQDRQIGQGPMIAGVEHKPKKQEQPPVNDFVDDIPF